MTTAEARRDHGSYWMYKNGCRCESCVENMRRRWESVNRRRGAMPHSVDATEVVESVIRLQNMGYTVSRQARKSEVSRETLQHLKSDYLRGDGAKATQTTIDKYLAAMPEMYGEATREYSRQTITVMPFRCDVPVYGQSVKVAEEFAEYFDAVTKYRKGSGDSSSVEKEWADLVQSLVNDAIDLGIDIRRAMAGCTRRNEERGRYGADEDVPEVQG